MAVLVVPVTQVKAGRNVLGYLLDAPHQALDDPAVAKRLSQLGGSIPAKQERTPESFERLVKAERIVIAGKSYNLYPDRPS